MEQTSCMKEMDATFRNKCYWNTAVHLVLFYVNSCFWPVFPFLPSCAGKQQCLWSHTKLSLAVRYTKPLVLPSTRAALQLCPAVVIAAPHAWVRHTLRQHCWSHSPALNPALMAKRWLPQAAASFGVVSYLGSCCPVKFPPILSILVEATESN